MQRSISIAACALLLTLQSCSDSDDPKDPEFSAFVSDLIDDTSDTTEPVEINGRTFRFSEDPATFDPLF